MKRKILYVLTTAVIGVAAFFVGEKFHRNDSAAGIDPGSAGTHRNDRGKLRFISGIYRREKLFYPLDPNKRSGKSRTYRHSKHYRLEYRRNRACSHDRKRL